jgi:hypothetical protein
MMTFAEAVQNAVGFSADPERLTALQDFHAIFINSL